MKVYLQETASCLSNNSLKIKAGTPAAFFIHEPCVMHLQLSDSSTEGNRMLGLPACSAAQKEEETLTFFLERSDFLDMFFIFLWRWNKIWREKVEQTDSFWRKYFLMIYQKRINWSVNSKCINMVNLYSYQQLKVKVTQLDASWRKSQATPEDFYCDSRLLHKHKLTLCYFSLTLLSDKWL